MVGGTRPLGEAEGVFRLKTDLLMFLNTGDLNDHLNPSTWVFQGCRDKVGSGDDGQDTDPEGNQYIQSQRLE
jgi:hypothetical protein